MKTDDTTSRSDPEAVGDDRFVHGLLQFMHHDSPGAQESRVRRVMDALPAPVAAPRRSAPRWRLSRLASMGGLAAAMIGIALILGLPTERSAHALVQSAIVASKDAGDRRYEIRVQLPHEDAPRAEAMGELDVSGERVVIRMRTPEGHMLVVGRDEEGEWAIRRDGGIERYNADRARPRWLDLGDGTYLVESVDALLAELAGGYVLDRSDAAPSPEALDGFWHVVARRTADGDREPGPERIELWIDPNTNIVARMELIWDRPAVRGRDDRPRDRRSGSGPRPPFRGEPPPPREGRRPPFEGGRPPRDGHRPPFEGGPRPGHGGHGFIDGPPRFRDGHHPPPPRRIIFEQVDAPEFGADWFRPEAHATE